MPALRRALLLGATALVGLGLILLLTGGTAKDGGAALGMLAAGWWGAGLIPVHTRIQGRGELREAEGARQRDRDAGQ
ncbi:hypothetical protein ACIHEI_32205 [Kitasatospora sp. NPDC051984]|uniref:hypothetical protein n=1 Tax=Kitasatospora sp. NPDC051984 TaxID=3364059 RepID=UPI0037C74394